jgi:hypothetical protein
MDDLETVQFVSPDERGGAWPEERPIQGDPSVRSEVYLLVGEEPLHYGDVDDPRTFGITIGKPPVESLGIKEISAMTKAEVKGDHDEYQEDGE